MALAIQLVSPHPVLTSAVEKLLSHSHSFSFTILPSSLTEAGTISSSNSPRLFLLDACSLHVDLGPLAARLRTRAPGSKFLVLLPPVNGGFEEKMRLFSWGIDGFVELDKSWQTELPRAIHSILQGQPWVPSEVLLGFVSRVKSLLDTQLLHNRFLTAREGQVLQFLLRRLTNKEISCSLGISERTVKYHVSNILSKLQLEDRRGLSSGKIAPVGPPVT